MSYSRDEFQVRSQRVAERVFEMPAYRDADNIAMYMGVGREVPTNALFADALERTGFVVLPVWVKRERAYRFVKHTKGQLLVPGPLGIPQPDGTDYFDVCDLNIVLIPGLAFSPGGARLGHGCGYYDRMLAAIRNDAAVLKVGLALQAQIFESLPMGPSDVHLDVVLTDENEYAAGQPCST